MGKGRNSSYGKQNPSLLIPKRSKSSSPSPPFPRSPKTPADEAIAFFQADLSAKEAPISVYELELDIDGGPHKEHSYIRLPPAYVPYVLRVSIRAGTPSARNGVFKTNFPLDGGSFDRNHITKRKLPTDLSKPIHVDLPISHAGAFVYWLEYDGDGPGERIKGRKGYFNVDPILTIRIRTRFTDQSPINLTVSPKSNLLLNGNHGTHLPLDGLSVLTVVSKWMGPIENWEKYIKEASERGYTMLHWTPLQERGQSGSPYSIKDQLRYDPIICGNKHKVIQILKLAKEEYGLLNLTDIVLNHTASDTSWLLEHPEAGYSSANSPHLSPALEIDTAMIEFSSSLISMDLPSTIASYPDLDRVMDAFERVLDSLNLWQFYVLDVNGERERLKTVLSSSQFKPWNGPDIKNMDAAELAKFTQEHGKISGLGSLAARFCVSVDPAFAASVIKEVFYDLQDINALADAWTRVVDIINIPLYREWKEDIRVALQNIRNRVIYTRLDPKGPRMGEITRDRPLVERYFTRLSPTPDADPSIFSLANNGWIWDADPLKNFALSHSKAYLRREVIVWDDCVKLRYGTEPSANPWLWNHMKSYVTALARLFDGFRIDNCHSTPLEVGAFMLDAARVVRPDLYVCAELFTGNEEMDLVFVRELGLNSLIRESGNGHDVRELSRLVHRHGLGKPIGSMDDICIARPSELPSPTGKGPVRPCIINPLYGSMPHALFYDLTHDNESPSDRRSAEDALSTAALVAFSYCAIGSTKGYDDLYPKQLDLVKEVRNYELTGLGENSGIARIKRILNTLHLQMVLDKFEEGHVHQENDYIIVHRVQPQTRKGYLLVTRTAFSKGPKDRGFINPIKLNRTDAKFLLGVTVTIFPDSDFGDDKTLHGLPSTLDELRPVVPQQCQNDGDRYCKITIPDHFPPGSIMIFETSLLDFDPSLEGDCFSGCYNAFERLDGVDLNVLLYRSDEEERDTSDNRLGVYDVPGYGRLVYCGLEGWMHPLRHIMRHNDLGHPLSANLRAGTWALDYVHERLTHQSEMFPNLCGPAHWFKERFDRVKAKVPDFMRPKYFSLIISVAYRAARQLILERSSSFVLSGYDFIHDLAMCATQMHGIVKSASLAPANVVPSLAAGLPHFSSGWTRCWGRDVFISLRGLFLATGNFDCAKLHIIAFASTLKHGLIPNLLDSARNPRYNSRDSPWWMLQNIQDYVKHAPDGISLLSESVKRRFPKDDTWIPWNDPLAYSYSSTISEIIQEILQRHAEGIHFREHNAGPNLDSKMTDEGFNIDIHVDWSNGLLFGGSIHNCGTWMDKMGESYKAGTSGVPGTPRDGAPIEITGLLWSCLTWLSELSDSGKFPFSGVTAKIDNKVRTITYKEWANLIQESFEKCYYIPPDPKADAGYRINSVLVNRRGIYKDVYGSKQEWSDYQFRPNFAIAMTVADRLFDEAHAVGCLRLADNVLRGPLGMKTLDPSDLQYRPAYDNTNDSMDPSIAKGLNYHNGPEWGWPLGYYLRASLQFAARSRDGKEVEKTVHHLHQILLIPRQYIRNDKWAGLPELTNENGQYCADSCNTQAWSAATLLDFLYDVYQARIV